MKKILLPILLLFIIQSVQSQDINKLNYTQLDSLTRIEYNKGAFDKAIPYIQAAREKAKTEYGNRDSVYAKYTGILAIFYTNVGAYSEAEVLYQEDLAIKEKLFGKEDSSYAITLTHLADLYRDMGNYAQSEKLYLESKRIKEKTIGKVHVHYATNLNNLATLYKDMGHFAKAEPLLLEAKEIRAKLFGKEDESYALSLNSLASFYQKMGNYDQAEPLLLEAKAINIKVLGKEHPEYVTSLNNLATLYQNMGHFEKAEPLFIEAKDILAAVFGKDFPSYATIINNLADLYKEMDNYAQAEVFFLETIGLDAKNLGTEHPYYALSLNNLANVYKRMGAYAKAEALLLEVKKINAKALGTEHPNYALCLESLASNYKEMGEYKKAEVLYLEAKNIRFKTLGKEHPIYALCLNSLSSNYLKMNKLDLAFQYALESINANSASIDSNSLDLKKLNQFDFYSNRYMTYALKNLLDILKAQFEQTGDRAKLELHYQVAKTAMGLSEHIRNELSSDGDKLRTLEENTNFVRHGIEAAILLKEDLCIQEAFSFAELNKSVLLADAVKGNRARALGDLPDTLVEKEIAFASQLTQLKKEQYQAKTPEEKETANRNLNDLNHEIDAFLKSIKNKYPQYHHLKYENITPKAADIQSILDDSTALLEYFLTDSTIYLFVVTKSNVKLYPIPISLKNLKNKIGILRNALTNYTFVVEQEEKAYKNYAETAYWFYKNILEIGLKDIPKIKNLVIITDGELGHLPFEVFLLKAAPQKTTYKDLSYLINNYNISYNYSATLMKENSIAKIHKNNGKILACGASYALGDSSLFKIRLPYFYDLRKTLQPLPAAQEEISTLAQKFQGDFLLDKAANEGFFKKNAFNYAIIHLAMHGILDSKQPMLSSLAFTENGDSLEDNFLQAFEIAHLKLNANLVVLSACETGYGKFTQGEGVISLARSFMYAGVPSLVVSLWQVNDHSTAEIMKNFYENLATGMTKDAALREAKLNYIHRMEGIAVHPAFWSPFILIGNTEPIILGTNSKLSFVWWILAAVVLVGGFGLLMKNRKK